MKQTFIFLFAALSLLTSCHKRDGKIQISGTTTGFTDSTMLILSSDEGKNIDTAYIINNNFKFEYNLLEPTVLVVSTPYNGRDKPDYKYFWVTDGDVKIAGTKGKFQDAQIDGSSIDIENTILTNKKKPINERMDSIGRESHKLTDKDSIQIDALRAQWWQEYLKLTTEDTLFIRENPNSLISAKILTFAMILIPAADTKNLYESLSKANKESKYGIRVKKSIELSKEHKIGDEATNIIIPNIKGGTIDLKSYRNNYILLDFWASWCGGCRMDNPNLRKNYETYKNRGFEIIGISSDKNKLHLEEAVKQDSMCWIIGCDFEGDDSDAIITYKINKFPTNYLIDPNGIIVDMNLRGDDLGKKLEEIYKNK